MNRIKEQFTELIKNPILLGFLLTGIAWIAMSVVLVLDGFSK